MSLERLKTQYEENGQKMFKAVAFSSRNYVLYWHIFFDYTPYKNTTDIQDMNRTFASDIDNCNTRSAIPVIVNHPVKFIAIFYLFTSRKNWHSWLGNRTVAKISFSVSRVAVSFSLQYPPLDQVGCRRYAFPLGFPFDCRCSVERETRNKQT